MTPPPKTPDRCPYCSFQPESLNDYCDEHRPKLKSGTPPPKTVAEEFIRELERDLGFAERTLKAVVGANHG